MCICWKNVGAKDFSDKMSSKQMKTFLDKQICDAKSATKYLKWEKGIKNTWEKKNLSTSPNGNVYWNT